MQNLAAAQFHDDQYIKDTEPGRDHGEEIAGNDDLGVVANKGRPPTGSDPELDAPYDPYTFAPC
jgi:hypothetical protein